eukprot:TRINITY_DN13161_c0_g1_i1.p1 TRINITY_DN13161_c0_g1~~TRINITY_DN13161_c0_g1_i1.p1  ORF type:complete len:190 (-),score=28.50 TRINITY_DN13161_c0_g1_i1:37-606(-)
MHYPIAFKSDAKPPYRGTDGLFRPELYDDQITLAETWEAMEDLVEQGLVKSIGVSNFDIQDLTSLLKTARIIPAINQVEIHPYLPQQDLLDWCKERKIIITAYSPLGQGRTKAPPNLLDEPVLVDLASRYNKTTAQIALRWALQRGMVVIPKAKSEEHLKQNIDVFDFELDQEAMTRISALSCGRRYLL